MPGTTPKHGSAASARSGRNDPPVQAGRQPAGESGNVQVRDDAATSRYEITVGGLPAGEAVYRERPGTVVFVHTQIDEPYAGRGLGAVLARAALDAARARGQLVVPLCPFIAAFIRSHQEYADLVDASYAGLVAPRDEPPSDTSDQRGHV